MGQLLPFQHHRLHRCRQSDRCALACHPDCKRQDRARLKEQTHGKTYFNKRLGVNGETPVWALFFFPALAHKISWAKSSPWGQLFALPEHFQIPVEYLSVQRVGCWMHFML